MLYELHITVDPNSHLGDWQQFCTSRGYKPLLIDLHNRAGLVQPEHPTQMMFAAIFEGTDAEAKQWSAATTGLVSSEFRIIREKLEVPLDKSGSYEDSAYFEMHAKALIDPECIGGNLRDSDDWLASRNMLFTHDQGFEKWYFTKRIYPDTDGFHMRVAWDSLYDGFGAYNWRNAALILNKAYTSLPEVVGGLVRMEMETVLHDTNPELDKGWV